MKYEINGFEDVFENKNLTRSLREANLESWIYGWRKILWYKFYLSLLCDWRFCFRLHKTVGML